MLLLLRTAFRVENSKKKIFSSRLWLDNALKSQPEALPSLVIMWGSIPFNVAQNDVPTLSPHCPAAIYKIIHSRSGVTHDRPLLRKVVDEPWTAIGRLTFKQRWFRVWLGLVGRMRRARIPFPCRYKRRKKSLRAGHLHQKRR